MNLDQVRKNNNDYLSLLSQNRRKQILRSLKKYEKKMGKLKIHIADNPNDALNIYQELIEKHQKRWTKRGHP